MRCGAHLVAKILGPFLLALVAVTACAPRVAPDGGIDAATARVTDDTLRMPDGARLPLHVWPARRDGDEGPDAVILGVHGFNDYGMGLDLAASYFAANDITVYAYDQRGFGAAPNRGIWPGERRLTRDFRHAVTLIKARHPNVPVHVLGVSMGGAVVLATAERGRFPDVDGIILSAPAVWARETMPFYQRWALWLGAHTLPWLTLTGEGLDRYPTDNMIALRRLSLDPKVIKATRIDAMHGLVNLMDRAFNAADSLPAPALVLYGDNDEIVPAAPTRRFWSRLADRDGIRKALYPEGWHMLLRDRQAYTVWRDIRSWMRDPTAPLPSQADADAFARLSGEDATRSAAREDGGSAPTGADRAPD